jgi:hypothetical protein
MKKAMSGIITQPDLAEKLGRSLSTLRYWRHIGHGHGVSRSPAASSTSSKT